MNQDFTVSTDMLDQLLETYVKKTEYNSMYVILKSRKKILNILKILKIFLLKIHPVITS